MAKVETVSATERYRKKCQDRVDVFQTDERTVIVVADGAGGVGAGDLAAESVVREVSTSIESTQTADAWSNLLRQIDFRISDGESTAIVVDIRPCGIVGASVGDSRVWIVNDGEVEDLTANQNRKPLLGSKAAQPVAFSYSSLDGLLLAGTDGLFDYAKRDQLIQMIHQTEFVEIPAKCIEMVRLPSGDMWDDVGIVVARNQPMS